MEWAKLEEMNLTSERPSGDAIPPPSPATFFTNAVAGARSISRYNIKIYQIISYVCERRLNQIRS